MNSLLRLQDSNNNDIATIDLETGAVVILRKDQLNEAAWAFWDAISTIGLCIRNQHSMPLFKDMILRAGKPGNPGDVILIAGAGSALHKGGSISVHNP